MTPALLATMLVVPLLSGGAGDSVELRVSASDLHGVEDRGLAHALSQALADVGLPADPATEASGRCRARCVRVSVRRAAEDLFVVEVRAGEQRAAAPLRLDPATSPFDRAHALAVEVELLADRPRPGKRRRPRAVAAARAHDETPAAEPAPPEIAAPPSIPRAEPTPVIETRPMAPAPPTDERVAFNVAAATLVGTSGGLLMHGAAVGLQVRLASAELRAGLSLLRPQHVRTDGVSLRREVLPLQLSATLGVPGLPGVRAGAGVEAISVSGDTQGLEMPAAWSVGGVARVEYRHRIRSFALLAAVQAAYHRASWIAVGNDNPLFVLPPWTVGASLGLEFRLL
jgi:hypothetical protein